MSAEGFTSLDLPVLDTRPSAAVEAEQRRGFAAGYAAGQRQAHQEASAAREVAGREHEALLVDTRARAHVALGVLGDAHQQMLERTASLARQDEDQVFALAIELAETLLSAELSDPVRSAQYALSRAAAACDDLAEVTVMVSTRDFETMQARGAEPEGVTVHAAADLAPGDVVVSHPDGLVNLRVADAIARVRADLFGADE
ncbi:hypothetical protein [Microbacterium sp. 77mftsu3.1]|uniref:FliH/SctL family protein n=1 Tax=Microbacterium sp. 77mftsu3.1 TaxID=1761802 RepID=UPI00035D8D60|nr:hypothetical protein [Microbacterium sp. 77mftsu3.1]SDH36546.1 flagellar assembly protein FliH [Microbacterium sp. 77mftsu3.1]